MLRWYGCAQCGCGEWAGIDVLQNDRLEDDWVPREDMQDLEEIE